ncbi:MAG: methionyl-tRNA formyltransferase, partial [Actinomycetaceae bacterium]|nr:methionyl-tRNA formyltransferase [Actinomycetaceae bacterium]
QKLLDIPTHGWLNLHYSLLPRWRGASPVQCAIAAGDTTIGTSVFQLEKGLDTGPVADMEEHEVSGRTAGEMLTYLSDTGVRQLVRVFAELENGTATFTAQTGEPTHAPLLRARDVKIDWTASAPAVDAWIRGFTPEPGPWTMLDGQRVKVGPVRVRPEITHLAPGEIAPGKQVLVGTGEAAVELGQVAPAGKTWMNAADWARGIKTDNPRFEVVDK